MEVKVELGIITDLLGNVLETVGAVCYTTPPRKVVINVLNWELRSELFKEMLVFHELGHCVLNRHHTDLDENYRGWGFLTYNGCPESIMHSGTTKNRMTDNCYQRFRDYYIMELFTEPKIRRVLFGSPK